MVLVVEPAEAAELPVGLTQAASARDAAAPRRAAEKKEFRTMVYLDPLKRETVVGQISGGKIQTTTSRRGGNMWVCLNSYI